MKLTINVTKEELLQAAENLVYTQSLDKDTEAETEACREADLCEIAVVIKEHLEKAIEDILSNPENYLKAEEWEQVNKCFVMNYSAYKRMMDRDIPYPI